jgi:hypothetical protein
MRISQILLREAAGFDSSVGSLSVLLGRRAIFTLEKGGSSTLDNQQPLLPVKRRRTVAAPPKYQPQCRIGHLTTAVNERTRHEHFIRKPQSHVLRQAVEAPRSG